MREIMTRKNLQQLMEYRNNPCLSLYMPTQRGGRGAEQNSIRFKNLLSVSREKLNRNRFSTRSTDLFLRRAEDLLKEGLFWSYQRDGFALFISDGFFQYYRLPLKFEEMAVVTNCFAIRPLLPLFVGNDDFYMLALSKKNARLLRGNRYTVSEIHSDELPDGLAETLKYDVFEKQLQYHTGTSNGRLKRNAVYHGHGSGKDDQQSNILRYMQQVDRGIHKLIGDEAAPLVLAGMEYLLSAYREANTYRHLMQDVVPGNPDTLPVEDLHRRAWTIVEPVFMRDRDESLERFCRMANTSRATHYLEEIVPAAHNGRVDTLLVKNTGHRWGSYDEDSGRVKIHDKGEDFDVDLLDAAVSQTLLHGGGVYAIPREKMPFGCMIAAIYRY